MAGLMLWPFGKQIVYGSSAFSFLVNVIWFLVCKAFVEVCDDEVYDTSDVVLCKRLEHDDFIKSVEELGTEVVAKLCHYGCICLGLYLAVLIYAFKPICSERLLL